MLMMSIFSTNSIALDSHENGMAFLLTLPFKRKYYVLEKYLFSFVIIMLMGVVMAVLTFVCNALGFTAFTAEAFKEALLVGIAFGMVMISLMIPVLVIFGVEKSRVAIVVIMGISFALYYVITTVFGDRLDSVPQFLMKLDSLSNLQTFLLVGGILLVLVTVSILITIKGLDKKEY